jgi:hypothetical protein
VYTEEHLKKTFVGFSPFPYQKEIIDSIKNDPFKFYVVNLSRQNGKTLLEINLMQDVGINNPGSTILFVSNNYKASKKVYSEFVESMEDSGIIQKNNKTALEITLINKTTYSFRSGQRPDSLRGYTYDYVFCDEFAFCRQNLWDVLRPATVVKGKKVIFCSTPNGIVGDGEPFFKLYNRGLSDKPADKLYKSFHADCYSNPLFTEEDILDAKAGMPADVFAAEYLAQFITHSSSAFRNVGEAVYGPVIIYSDIGPLPGRKYTVGIDLGRVKDKTVCIVMDQDRNVVDYYRAGGNGIHWDQITEGLLNIFDKWKPSHGFIEVNSIGDVVYDTLLTRHKLHWLKPFFTGNNTKFTKQDLIEELQLAFEQKKIRIPDTDFLQSELSTFIYKYDKFNKKVILGARNNSYYDDSVIALALCLHSHKTLNPTEKRYTWERL